MSLPVWAKQRGLSFPVNIDTKPEIKQPISYIESHVFCYCHFQIVIQVGDAGYRDGAILVRTAEYRQGACPIHFLQEV